MGHRSWIPFRGFAVATALFAALLVAACSAGPDVTLVNKSASYTVAQAEEAARSASLGAISGTSADAAPQVRQQVLASLRRHGAEGQKVADYLTKGFPADTLAVPVRVESANVDGMPAYIVLEATGRAGGPMTGRRVWVFSQSDGAVIASASYR